MNKEYQRRKQNLAFNRAGVHDAEWIYRYEERLAILTEGRTPTWGEEALAAREADEWEKTQPV